MSRITCQEVPRTPVGPQEKASILGGPQVMAQILVESVAYRCITVFICLTMEMQFGGEKNIKILC